MDLITTLENVQFGLGQALESIAARDEGARRGYSYVYACTAHRKIGCVRLQAYGDRTGFAASLMDSARLWTSYWESMTGESEYDPECLCGSKFNPLFDALAAGSVASAVQIARLFPERHQPDWEYETDYLFYRFACRFLRARADTNGQTPEELLHAWEELLAGEEDSYYGVCVALLAADEAGFVERLTTIIDEREARFEAWRRSPSYIPEIEHASRHIYVNGLGLLRLAELAGVRVTEALPTMPMIARLPVEL